MSPVANATRDKTDGGFAEMPGLVGAQAFLSVASTPSRLAHSTMSKATPTATLPSSVTPRTNATPFGLGNARAKEMVEPTAWPAEYAPAVPAISPYTYLIAAPMVTLRKLVARLPCPDRSERRPRFLRPEASTPEATGTYPTVYHRTARYEAAGNPRRPRPPGTTGKPCTSSRRT